MSDCVPWERGKNAYGYGVVRMKDRTVLAHRRAMAEIHGWEAINGRQVNHRCDMRACINPDHLYIGSQAENMQDMYERGGRSTKLTAEQVREIRAAVNATQRQLAARYGVALSTVQDVLSGHTWRRQ